MIAFHPKTPWPRITALARKAKKNNIPIFAASPYATEGADRLLPMAPGSVLITAFTLDNIRSGSVSPAFIHKLIESSGVRVYENAHLHAKVFVIGDRAIVGSANFTANSPNLDEACIETDDKQVVKATIAMIEGMRTGEITAKYAQSLVPEFKICTPSMPPRLNRLWIARCGDAEWSEDETDTGDAMRPHAKRLLQDSKHSRVGLVVLDSTIQKRVVKDDRYMHVKKEGARTVFLPVGRVLMLESAVDADGKKSVVAALETAKNAPDISFSDMKKAVGAVASEWRTMEDAVLVRKGALIARIDSAWL
jgi:hypothetical protein